MNKDKLKKNLGYRVRLRPPPIRTNEAADVELGCDDDDWIIADTNDAGVRIKKLCTGHTTILAYDHIHHFTRDPTRDRGELKHGFLRLNVQIFFNSSNVWPDPL